MRAAVKPLGGSGVKRSKLPEVAVTPKNEARTSGEISYDISALAESRYELTESLSKLNNGTGRLTDEGKALIDEIESELSSIGIQEKALKEELELAKAAEEQTLIDSGEYRKANLYDVTVNSFNQGRYNAKYGQESYKAMTGAENEKETYAEILAGDDYKYVPQSALGKVVSNAASMLGQQFQQLNDKRVLNAGIAGAATSAGVVLAAGQAGPQIAAPEEVVTVPVAAMTGFVTGMNAGSAAVNFEIEAGLAYNEMIANGVSEETARVIALGVGGANAALEAVQLDELTDAFKITKRTGATENFAKKLAKEIVKRTGGVLKESAQEVAQEGVTIGGTQFGSMYDTGKWAYNAQDVMNRLNDTAKSSVFSFGLLNLPADVVAMQQQLAELQFQKRKDELAAVYEKNVEIIKNDSPSDSESGEARQINFSKMFNLELDESANLSDETLAVFDKKYLAKSDEERLPNYKTAQVTDQKLAGYALNMNHSGGRDKAIAFQKALGYTVENKDLLVEQIYQGLEKYRAIERNQTKYGRPFEVSMMVQGVNGKYAKVKTAWIIDNDSTVPRLVSIYVDK